MTGAREDILGGIQAALRSALLPRVQIERPVVNLPRHSGGIAAFVQEVKQVSGRVIQVDTPEAAINEVVRLCQDHEWDRVLAWTSSEIGLAGLDRVLDAAGIQAVHSGSPLDLADLPVGITGAEAALADTGTLILRSGSGRSQVVSLLPPVHVALLDSRRIYPDMLSYFESLPDSTQHIKESSNLVFVTGPSRTADIEQTLTLGVHGPREVIIILY